MSTAKQVLRPCNRYPPPGHALVTGMPAAEKNDAVLCLLLPAVHTSPQRGSDKTFSILCDRLRDDAMHIIIC